MNGYLMQEKTFLQGEDTFIESYASANQFGVVFEDDGQTGYFYAVEISAENPEPRILDALHIYEAEHLPPGRLPVKALIVWSKDWLKCALVLDDRCHALFDFSKHGGYNINEFPPPNQFWTKQDRKLTNDLLKDIF